MCVVVYSLKHSVNKHIDGAYSKFGITMDDGPPQSFYFFVSFLEVVEIKICSSTFFYNFLEVVEGTIN